MKKLSLFFLSLLIGTAAFADTKISALPAAAAQDGTEVVPEVQAGVTVKATTAAVANAGAQTGDVTKAVGSGVTAIAVGAVTDTKGSLAVKPAVTVVATSNQALTGTPTIDGQATADGSIILNTAQSAGAENGPWVAHAGAWTRPTWYAAGNTTQAFQFITTFVRLGSTYQGTTWRQTAAAPITIDTTATTWAIAPLAVNSNTVTGTLPATLEPAHTGDMTNSAGSLATLVKQLHPNVTAITNASSPYSVAATDSMLTCDATAGAVVINLPAATGTNREISIKKTDSSSNACTPTRAGSDLIDGATSYSLTAQYAASKVQDSSSGVWIRTHTSQLVGDVTGATTANQVVGLHLAAGSTGLGITPTWTGLHTWSFTGQTANTQIIANALVNSTAAAAANQQEMCQQLTGQGWKTTATAGSQTVDWLICNVPVQGAANPSTSLILYAQVNGGGYTAMSTLTSGGNLTLGGNANATFGSATASRNITGAYFLNTGTKFTTSGCSISSTTGGGVAGTFTLGANTCTAVITMNGATGATAANGWSCQAHDRTAPTVLIGGESSSTTTTASFTIPVTAGTTDVISFSCTGF